MIDYAGTDDCRRRVILTHFGDSDPADAPDCCDNCRDRAQAGSEIRPAESEAEQVALHILGAVAELHWNVGGRLLAKILRGSRAKQIRTGRYDRLRAYGRLAAFTLLEIDGLIDQLVRMKYLKGVGSDRPVLRLTPQGQQALQRKGAIPLSLPRPIRREEEERHRPSPDASRPDHETLFEALRAWRLERARELGIPAFCVFHDRTLQAIASALPTSPAALLSIKGVGPSKLKAYGAAILDIVNGWSAPDPKTASVRPAAM
jgi:ATP-dependent DNA helicase RecQ